MNRLSILFLGLAVTSASFANIRQFRVTAQEQGNQITLNFSTTKQYSSMCSLEIHDLHLADARTARIELQVAVNPERPCLTAFGPNSGNLVFERGFAFPALPEGEYGVKINSEFQGQLIVRKNGVEFLEPLTQ